MVFSSLIFLFAFLPLSLLGYYALPSRMRNGFLLTVSVLFYLWGAPRFFFVLMAAAVFDYVLGNILAREEDVRTRRRLLALGLTVNATLLAYFKYSNFFVAELNGMLAHAGFQPIPWAAIALPIGISFITFEEMSYLIDIHRRVTKPAPSFPVYALFLCLFPHLIAGPIFRYHDVADQLLSRTHSSTVFFEGILRFARGLAKKTLIADPVAQIADTLFAASPASLSPGYAWLAILAYTIQIYFDFSGYSDMAIGLGRMFGFRFVENFNRPYTAESITDFWRRWHISLSNWMKEYLYIPLGGNRHGPARTYCNLWFVFLLSGFWHGANWTFLLWGAYHGLFLVLERLFLLDLLVRVPSVVRRLWTFLVVVFGWVLFRSDSVSQALAFWGRLLFLEGGRPPFLLTDVASDRALTMLVFGIVTAACLPAALKAPSRHRRLAAASAGCAAIVLLFLSTLSLVNSQFHPFIYFRF